MSTLIYEVPVNIMTKGFIWVDLVFKPLLTSVSRENNEQFHQLCWFLFLSLKVLVDHN